MTIGSMDNVDVTPFQWPSGWSERGRRNGPRPVIVGVSFVTTF